MSKNRNFMLVAVSVTALVAAGGASAFAADGGSSRASTPALTRGSDEMGMRAGARSATMMTQLDAAAVRRMMSGMSVHLSGAELKAMTDAHNAMVTGMLSDNMMSGAGTNGGH